MKISPVKTALFMTIMVATALLISLFTFNNSTDTVAAQAAPAAADTSYTLFLPTVLKPAPQLLNANFEDGRTGWTEASTDSHIIIRTDQPVMAHSGSSEGLYPTNDNGRSAVVISATHLKWMGMRFCELSISVHVSRQANGRTLDGVFLVHAFNSKPLLALLERTFFQTPYYGGSIYGVKNSLPQMQLCAGQTLLFQAIMVGQRLPEKQKEYLWEGPIHLPTSQTKKTQVGRYFYGRISGSTKVYPFRIEDKLWLPAPPGNTVFHWLRDSHFQATEWQVRLQARHAKSKTINQASLDHLTAAFVGS